MAGLVATLLVAAVIRKAVEYAADPAGDKDCPPLSPGHPGDAATRSAIAPPAALPWSQHGGTINDASCLNRTRVYGIVRVRQDEDVRAALRFAREHGLRVSIAESVTNASCEVPKLLCFHTSGPPSCTSSLFAASL